MMILLDAGMDSRMFLETLALRNRTDCIDAQRKIHVSFMADEFIYHLQKNYNA